MWHGRLVLPIPVEKHLFQSGGRCLRGGLGWQAGKVDREHGTMKGRGCHAKRAPVVLIECRQIVEQAKGVVGF